MANQSKYNHQESLIFLTNRIGRMLAAQMRKKKVLQQYDLMPQDIGLLVDLWSEDGLKQQDLAFSIIKDKATITRMLDRLEEKNIVVRVPDAVDKRTKRIYLTHKGKQLEQEVWPSAQEVVAHATSDISENDLKVCKKVLFQIYQHLLPKE